MFFHIFATLGHLKDFAQENNTQHYIVIYLVLFNYNEIQQPQEQL